ncbi:MAG: hypothetical protein HYV60_24085, partial [Planctomycetia bacterium]|nr:hypothetical protein [Planctomycetia bacterium]
QVEITASSPGFTSVSQTVVVTPVENFEEYNREGDRNLPRDQGQLLIESNFITNSAGYGIAFNAATRGAGGSLTYPAPVIRADRQQHDLWRRDAQRCGY